MLRASQADCQFGMWGRLAACGGLAIRLFGRRLFCGLRAMLPPYRRRFRLQAGFKPALADCQSAADSQSAPHAFHKRRGGRGTAAGFETGETEWRLDFTFTSGLFHY